MFSNDVKWTNPEWLTRDTGNIGRKHTHDTENWNGDEQVLRQKPGSEVYGKGKQFPPLIGHLPFYLYSLVMIATTRAVISHQLR